MKRMPTLPDMTDRVGPVTWVTSFNDSIASMVTSLTAVSKIKEKVFPLGRELSQKTSLVLHLLHCGSVDSAKSTAADATTVLSALMQELEGAPDFLRGAQSWTLSSYVCTFCLNHFFATGLLGSVTDFEGDFQPNDTEYLLGVMSLCHELKRYAVGRATHRDVSSVQLCKELLSQVLKELMAFDFRNGPLRRNFDKVKYAYKHLEDLLYEMSLGETNNDECDEKKESLLDTDTFTVIRERLEVSDARREQVIKRSRDVQKLSKQAIYSLQRGEMDTARQQLEKASGLAHGIKIELVDEEPSLRTGSFSNSMEEWAEGRLFEEWLKTGKVMTLEELKAEIDMNEEEYLGGLGDLTGEIGRWAVACATKRDAESVKRALRTDLCVMEAMMQVGSLVPKMSKKSGAVETNMKKLEVLLYELSLVKGTKRKTLQVSPKEDPAPEEQ